LRLLAAADTHGFEDVCQWLVDQAQSFQVDAVVLAGDLLGVPHGFESVEQAMLASATSTRQILTSVEYPVLYIMGNDDLVDLGPDVANIVSIHGRRVELEGFGFVGYQCGPPFMGIPTQARRRGDSAAERFAGTPARRPPSYTRIHLTTSCRTGCAGWIAELLRRRKLYL